MSSTAEALAFELERGDTDIRVNSGKGRSKKEMAENKHIDSNGLTRQIVNNGMNGERRRRTPKSS